jgi:hypothetical protein
VRNVSAYVKRDMQGCIPKLLKTRFVPNPPPVPSSKTGTVSGQASVQQFGSNPNVEFDPTTQETVRRKLIEHGLRDGRFDGLGMSRDKLADNVLNFVEQNKALLRTGGNQWTGNINGVPINIRVDVNSSNFIQSVNTLGTTNRVYPTMWNFANLTW